MDVLQMLADTDAMGRGVALLLLAMSVATWVVALYKGWLLHRAARALPLAMAAFWQARDIEDGERRLRALDTHGIVHPLLSAATGLQADLPDTLAVAGDRSQRLTRVLRDALHGVLARLQYGQTLLASVGATAPFVGLLGTVWGIHQALAAIGAQERFRIEQVAGPVGEALVMTAAGLAVAIPAVLAYNVLGQRIAQIEADLEGFARDLRELLLHPDTAP